MSDGERFGRSSKTPYRRNSGRTTINPITTPSADPPNRSMALVQPGATLIKQSSPRRPRNAPTPAATKSASVTSARNLLVSTAAISTVFVYKIDVLGRDSSHDTRDNPACSPAQSGLLPPTIHSKADAPCGLEAPERCRRFLQEYASSGRRQTTPRGGRRSAFAAGLRWSGAPGNWCCGACRSSADSAASRPGGRPGRGSGWPQRS